MNRLFVVSNRLPVTVEQLEGKVEVRESSGGLVTALKAVFKNHEGGWIGWPGVSSLDTGVELPSTPEMKLIPVFLTERERQDFYCGFSNEIIWPLFHDLQSRCSFDPCYWNAYVEVNQRFAAAVLEHAREGDLVWVHDYHLALMGGMLRGSQVSLKTGYFQHIPFPSLDILEKLPWANQIIESMLAFKVIGFQTRRDLRNFATCVRSLGLGRVHNWNDELVVNHEHGISTAKAFPVSIDFEKFEKDAASHEVEHLLKEMRTEYRGRKLVLGVDRLDYTKGIPERLRSFARAMELYPELRKEVSLVQVVVPSREGIPKYMDLKMEVERLVSQINGRFTEAGWVPIHFLYRHLERAELLAYYRLADVALITPLKDGMNLVCKEYCAADIDEDGMLVLSQFAGAAADLAGEAIVVNPNDYDQVARQLSIALTMGANERKGRMSCIRAQLRRCDVNHWIESFLAKCRDASGGTGLALPIDRHGRYYVSHAGGTSKAQV